jgi:hypothetical protein
MPEVLVYERGGDDSFESEVLSRIQTPIVKCKTEKELGKMNAPDKQYKYQWYFESLPKGILTCIIHIRIEFAPGH